MHILPWRRSTRAANAKSSFRSVPIRPVLVPFEAFSLQASCGGTLRVGSGDDLVVNAPPGEPAPDAPLVLLRLAAAPGFGFAIAGDAAHRRIGVDGDSLRAPVLSYVLPRFGEAGEVAIRHPLVELHACSIPQSPGVPGAVRIDRAPIGGWEVHRLVPHAWTASPSPRVVAALESVVAPLAGGLGVTALLEWLASIESDLIATIGPALLRLAAPSVLGAVSASISQDAELAARIGRVWPDPDLVATALPALAGWLQRERPRRAVVEVGPEHDGLAARQVPGLPLADLSARMVAGARAVVRPRLGAAIVTTARNEGIYLLDWIAHHRAIGFEHVFVYSNDNDHGSDALLARLAEHGALTWLPNRTVPPVSPQRKALTHAFCCLPDVLDHRWIAVLDVDEFVVLDPARYGSIGALLDLTERRGGDALALNWRVHTPNRRLDCPDTPLVARMPLRAATVNPHVKTISRPSSAWASTPHAPIWPDGAARVTLDADGAPHCWPVKPFGESEMRRADATGPAWIAHYHLKSLPEFIWKSARNRGDESPRAGLQVARMRFAAEFLDTFDDPGAVEDPVPSAFSARVAEERERLAALPGVEAAHQEAVRIFRAETGRMMRGLLLDPSPLPVERREAFLGLLEASLATGFG